MRIVRDLWNFLLTAYHRSPGELWLAGGLMARGLWFIAPWFNALAGPPYDALNPARLNGIEIWWGSIQLLVGLLQFLALARGGVKARLLGMGLGVWLWLFIALAAHTAYAGDAVIVVYFGFVLAHVWRAWQTATSG